MSEESNGTVIPITDATPLTFMALHKPAKAQAPTPAQVQWLLASKGWLEAK